MKTADQQCRTCMLIPANFIELNNLTEHGISISEMLATSVPQLSIDQDDQLPAVICDVCLDKLKITYEFQEMCILSEHKMRTEVMELPAILPEPTQYAQDTIKVEVHSDADEEEQKDVSNMGNNNMRLVDDEQHDEKETEIELLTMQEEPTFKPDFDESNDMLAVTSGSECSESLEQGENDTITDCQRVRTRNSSKKIVLSDTTPRMKRERLRRVPRKSIQCGNCDAVFNTHTKYLKHKMEEHKEVTKYTCKLCNKVFKHSNTLKNHLRIHSGDEPLLCYQCGKIFANKNNLSQHILRHSAERRYQCEKCPSKFACQSDLTKHRSTHNAIKPHVCDTCGARFTRSYTLSKHKFLHTGKRPHKCEECSMTFVFIDHLRRHMRTHTGEKPYKCQFCERAYAESGDLTKHLRKHVGEKTYKCAECPAAFKYLNELRAHNMEHYRASKVLAAAQNSS